MTIMIARLIHYAFSVYQLGLLAYVVCSWIAHPTARSVRLWLARFYEPLLIPIRRVVPALRTGHTAIDFSPLILLIGLALARGLLISILLPPF
ncbi:MAG: YggT family protein [Kiritimatiellae bacterium]|nr:YggT family protein [Kiritimatiellia bacterium]